MMRRQSSHYDRNKRQQTRRQNKEHATSSAVSLVEPPSPQPQPQPPLPPPPPPPPPPPRHRHQVSSSILAKQKSSQHQNTQQHREAQKPRTIHSDEQVAATMRRTLSPSSLSIASPFASSDLISQANALPKDSFFETYDNDSDSDNHNVEFQDDDSLNGSRNEDLNLGHQMISEPPRRSSSLGVETAALVESARAKIVSRHLGPPTPTSLVPSTSILGTSASSRKSSTLLGKGLKIDENINDVASTSAAMLTNDSIGTRSYDLESSNNSNDNLDSSFERYDKHDHEKSPSVSFNFTSTPVLTASDANKSQTISSTPHLNTHPLHSVSLSSLSSFDNHNQNNDKRRLSPRDKVRRVSSAMEALDSELEDSHDISRSLSDMSSESLDSVSLQSRRKPQSTKQGLWPQMYPMRKASSALVESRQLQQQHHHPPTSSSTANLNLPISTTLTLSPPPSTASLLYPPISHYRNNNNHELNHDDQYYDKANNWQQLKPSNKIGTDFRGINKLNGSKTVLSTPAKHRVQKLQKQLNFGKNFGRHFAFKNKKQVLIRSNSPVFSLYAVKYSKDQYHYAVSAFKRWYHKHLTYHHLSRRMEFDKKSFKSWFASRGKPLSLLTLDHYDRIVIWIRDERDAIQEKTFTKWINKYLKKRSSAIGNLFLDLRDGQHLISLLELLSGETLPRERGKMRVHMLQNIQIALNFMRHRKVRLVNIRPEEIVDGNQKLTLGLIWTIILHFQLETDNFREVLLKWAQKTTKGYPGCCVTDLTSSWRDGLAFCAIIHRNRPDLLDYKSCRTKTPSQNLERAFIIAERDLNITRLLDPEDVDVPCPDEKSMITYLAQFYELFPDATDRNPLLEAEKIRRIDEYKELASRLLAWIKEATHSFKQRNFPKTIPEIKVLIQENNRFKLEEVPAKAHDKQRLASISQDVNDLAQDVKIEIDDEYSSNNIDFHWTQMLKSLHTHSDDLDALLNHYENLSILQSKLVEDIDRFDERLNTIENGITKQESLFSKVDATKHTNYLDQNNLIHIREDLLDAQKILKNFEVSINDYTKESGKQSSVLIDLHKRVIDHGKRRTNLETQLFNLQERYRQAMEKFKIMNENMDKFKSTFDRVWEQIDGLDNHLETMFPVALELSLLQKQLVDIEEFERKLMTTRDNLNDAARLVEESSRNGLVNDINLLENEIRKCKEKFDHVETKAADKLRGIESSLNKLERIKIANDNFNNKLDAIRRKLEDEETNLKTIDPSNEDPNLLQKQIFSMKNIIERFEILKGDLNALTNDGESLIHDNLASDPRKMRNDMRDCQTRLSKLENQAQQFLVGIENAMKNREIYEKEEAEFFEKLDEIYSWLDDATRVVNNEKNVYGDLDTVNALIEQHKAFEQELKSKETLMENVDDMINRLMGAHKDSSNNKIRAKALSVQNKWKDLNKLAIEKSNLLQDAFVLGKNFHDSVHELLEWLAEIEMKLRFSVMTPDDEVLCKREMLEHENLLEDLAEKAEKKQQLTHLAQTISSKCHPDADPVLKHWTNILQSRWDEIEVWAKQRSERLEEYLRSLDEILKLVEGLICFLSKHECKLVAEENASLPDSIERLEVLMNENQMFAEKLRQREPDVDKIVKVFASRITASTSRTIVHSTTTKRPDSRASSGLYSGGSRSATPVSRTSYATYRDEYPDVRHPRVRIMVDKWRSAWQLTLDQMQRLKDKMEYLQEVERLEDFDMDDWRKRFLHFMKDKKARIMDFYRSLDKDNDGRILIPEFIDGVIRSKFNTTKLEMARVADVFDKNHDGTIDYKEYLDALRPDKPVTDDEVIQDEVQRQVSKCTCSLRYKVYHVGEGKYRFGESQKLRLVRILRSKVMVRVGGGWEALEEFLQKNDPCRTKGRTNVELREQFILPEKSTQAMVAFKSKISNIPKSSSPQVPLGPVTKIREKTDRSLPMKGTIDRRFDHSP